MRTLFVSLPNTTAETPPLPCEAITIKSQRFCSAVRRIASQGRSCLMWIASQRTPASSPSTTCSRFDRKQSVVGGRGMERTAAGSGRLL